MNTRANFARQALEMEMIRLRHWQHIMNEDLKKKLFTVPIHVAFGSEAIAVAVSNIMTSDDQLALTHRNMAYNLARAGALKPVYEEYKLSGSGVSGGRMGSMNMVNPARGIVYSSSTLGNNFSVACGLALAKRAKREPGVVIVTTGDGAMEEGGFYEALVFAKSQRLKLMIVVENNNHSMSSTIEQRRCDIAIEKMCEAVNVRYKLLATNDVFEYVPVLSALRTHVDEQATPLCVEAKLALMNQHAGPTPGWPADPMNVDIKNGMVVRDSVDDPLHVLKQTIGAAEFDKLAAQVSSQKWN